MSGSNSYNALTEREAASRLASMRDVDIVCHVSPDADTLGCALALHSILNANGIHAEIACSDPVPEYLRFLTEDAIVSDFLRDGVTRVSVDVASPAQLGRFAPEAHTFSLMLDHHGRGEQYADHVVEPDAAACGEIIFRVTEILRDEHGFTVPAEAVTYIYAAISGDTGSFRFANTTPTTHRIAARLHEMGARTEWCAHNLHAVKTQKQLSARLTGLSHMRFCHDGKLAVTYATRSDMEYGGFGPGDFSEADEMRSISGVLVGVSLREVGDGEWRASTRANVPVDCASVCAHFGGGGHLQAAGCNLRAPDAESAIRMIAERFGTAIDEYERSL